MLLSRPAAINSSVYVVKNGATEFRVSVKDGDADTLKPFVAYTSSGDASVSSCSFL